MKTAIEVLKEQLNRGKIELSQRQAEVDAQQKYLRSCIMGLHEAQVQVDEMSEQLRMVEAHREKASRRAKSGVKE